MKIKIEYEYDPKHRLTPFFARVGDLYFAGDSFLTARERAIKYFKLMHIVEEVEIRGDERNQIELGGK